MGNCLDHKIRDIKVYEQRGKHFNNANNTVKDIDNKNDANITPLNTVKFMLVDDIALNTMVLKELLIVMGANSNNIHTCQTGQDAIEYAATNKNMINIIMIDIKMSPIDGYQTTIKLRDNGFENIIIGITGMADKESIEKGKQSGMNTIYVKPISIHNLEMMFNKYNISTNNQQ